MKVSVVMGSKSDYDAVSKAVKVLDEFGVESEVRIISAHRTPHIAAEFADTLITRGVECVIACAGKAAHLAGVIAGHTTLPVIGVPMMSSTLDGLDSLLSVVQMPSGVPVATVAINGTENAGLLAVQILGIKYPDLAKKLVAYKKKMEQATIAADKELNASLNNDK